MRHHDWKPIFYPRALARVGSLWFCCLCGTAGQTAFAQTPTPGTVPAQSVSVSTGDLFAKDLETLSQRLGVAFVAEGRPYPVTKSGDVPTLSKDLSQADAIREVADYFDYSAVGQGKVVVLTKRYTNPDDIPDVTPEECQWGLKNLFAILTPFNPKYPPATLASEPRAEIAHMLTGDQLARLSKDGVPVSELTPEQHKEALRLALYPFQTDATRIEKAYNQIEERNSGDPVFHWGTLQGVEAFGYDTLSLRLHRTLFIPVSAANRIWATLDGMVALAGEQRLNGVIVSVPDPTEPADLSEPMRRFLDERGASTHTVTLAEAISSLNRRTANQEVYKVDAMFGTKHVMLVGEDKSPEPELLQALAEVYGLHVAHNGDGSLLLTHPVVIEAKQISELGRSLRTAIPDPIYRAMTAGAHMAARNMGPDADKAGVGYHHYTFVSHRYALQMFRYLVEPQVKYLPERRQVLSHFDERVRNLFAFASVVEIYGDAWRLAARPLPPHIADFDHDTLTGRIYRNGDDTDLFDLSFNHVDPKTGEKRSSGGFSQAKVPPMNPKAPPLF